MKNFIASVEKFTEEKHLRDNHLLDLLPAAMYVCDPEGIIVKYNLMAVDLWGQEPQPGDTDQKFCGSFKLYYTDGRPLPHEETPMALTLKDGVARRNLEVVIERPDRSRITARVNIAPLKDKDGKVTGAINCFQDITAQKELEKIKDDFINVASHELKTPITTQKLCLELLEEHVQNFDNEEARQLFKKTVQQTEKIEKLVKNLLDINKITKGKFELNLQMADLNTLVSNVVEEVQPLFPKHKLILQGMINTPLKCDEDKIAQVLVNLISNAIKYSPNADKVLINLREEKDKAWVEVVDFGLGIEQQYQDKIFDRFTRVSGKSEDTFPGMGIGLFITSEIIKMHSGKISVISEKGKGSMFYFYIPFLPAHHEKNINN